ncbi:MAG: GTPase HflX [Clostridia bacterium]
MNDLQFENKPEKAYLIGIDYGQGDVKISMLELAELVKTAGGEVFDSVIQNRDSVDPKICIGKGKLIEIRQIIEENDVDIAIFDIELAPTQIYNIQKILKVPVIDRTILILDIFAIRAKTSEGKLQVELAQLKHKFNSLRGKGIVMSRQGGGIGTRGPGETQLETDRRHIQRRIDKIEADLEKVVKQRGELRKNRLQNQFKTVSIVGYTNAGKSTLFNTLTQSEVLAMDKLFATLDPTVRALKLEQNDVMLIDTVGFIRNLPHFLVNAFKSTLEEVVLSDLVLLLCDFADKDCFKQQEITLKILEELGYKNKIIKVYNKCDLVSDLSATSDGISISAVTGFGLEDLKKRIATELFPSKTILTLKVPYENGEIISALRSKKCIISENYEENYQIIQITIDNDDVYMYNKYITNDYS